MKGKVDLPEKIHPLLIDRMVCFIYTSAYPANIDPADTKITTLLHYNSIPSGAPGSSFELPMNYTQFQIAMFGLGENLEFPALMAYAFGQLVRYFLHESKAQEHVTQLIEIAFEPHGALYRLCKDNIGALQTLSIAAVLVHEKLHWSGLQIDQFRDLLADELDQSTWKEYRACYKQVKDSNQGLLAGSNAMVKSLTSAMGKVDIQPNIEDVLHSLFDEYAYWTLTAIRIKTGQSSAVIHKVLPKIARQIKGGMFNCYWQRKAKFNRHAKWMSAGPDGGSGHRKNSRITSYTLFPGGHRTRAHDSPKLRSRTQPPSMRTGMNDEMSSGFASQTMSMASASIDDDDGVCRDYAIQDFGITPRNNTSIAERKIAMPGLRFVSAPLTTQVTESNAPGRRFVSAPLTTQVADFNARGELVNTEHVPGMHADLMASQYAPMYSILGDKAAAVPLSATIPPHTADNPFLMKLRSLVPKKEASEEDIVANNITEWNQGPNTDPALTEYLQAQPIAAPAMPTFDGIGGRTMEFAPASPVLIQSGRVVLKELGALQLVGAARKVGACKGKKLFDHEGNKENIEPLSCDADVFMD